LLLEILVVVALTIVNGLLAMSELAVVSSRPARLKVLEEQGSRGAGTALELSEQPGRFLSTVQIGITLVGVLSGAFSGATLGARLTAWLQTQGVSDGIADALGVGSVVVAITYLSLIVGELVPKQVALRDPEKVASKVAPAMKLLSRLAAPLVWLLDGSGRFVLGVLGQKGEAEEKMTEEEVKTIIAEAESAGILESDEKAMISGVMRLADRTARALMTPRREVEVVDLSDSRDHIREQLRATRRSRVPIQDGEPDDIVGIAYVKDLIEAMAQDQEADLRAHIQSVPVVLDGTKALDVLRNIRSSSLHMALVVDEHGHFEGIVTSGDVLEAIAGAFKDEIETEAPIIPRDDGSFLVSGWMPIDECSEQLALGLVRTREYETVAGFALSELGRIPRTGEKFVYRDWTFEIVDMDGRRIDKLIASRASSMET
jgi:putative hemolysin